MAIGFAFSVDQSLIDSGSVRFQENKVGFSISARGHVTNLKLFSVFALPNESLFVSCASCDEGTGIRVAADDNVPALTAVGWRWIAPSQPGIHDLIVTADYSADTMCLRIFVLHPFSEVKNGTLNGYRIGQYPKKPYKGLPQYNPPRGFVEVTEENADILLTPHFRLRQFLCKQDGEYPKYVVLRSLLLLKLEYILEKVNQAGYRCDTFGILSGYRTPWYNKAIGNVKYSRHQWGGAVDFYIDENPVDSMMDDLNRDGKINWKDAALLYDIVDDMYGTEPYERFIGGLGRYRKTEKHGPFVHVDVRGFRARWGD
ncbi:MAG: hypothetical protein R3F48_00380 [Candidatus Zixiibacteriota bacterium]